MQSNTTKYDQIQPNQSFWRAKFTPEGFRGAVGDQGSCLAEPCPASAAFCSLVQPKARGDEKTSGERRQKPEDRGQEGSGERRERSPEQGPKRHETGALSATLFQPIQPIPAYFGLFSENKKIPSNYTNGVD